VLNKPDTTDTPTVDIEVSATIPPGTPRVEINGVVATLTGSAYKANLPLTVGSNNITAIAYNGASEVARSSFDTTYVASIARTLTANITRPQYTSVPAATVNFVTALTTANVYGTVAGVPATTVLIRDAEGSTRIAKILIDGTYNESITAYSGYNEVIVTAYGPGGALATATTGFMNFTADDTPVVVITSPTACSVVPSVPATINIVASAFSPDQANRSPGNFTATFKANNLSVGNANKGVASFDNNINLAWTNVQNGTYQLKASLNDNAVTTSAPVKVTVSGTVIPPTVALTAPVNNTTVGSPITLTLNAQNIVGTIATVEFLDGTNQIIGYNVNVTSSNYSLNTTWDNPTSGSHSLTVRVTNSAGVTLTSSPITVTVRAAPTVNLSAAGSFYLAPGNVDLLIGVAAVETGAILNRVEIYSSVVTGSIVGAPALVTMLSAPPYRYRLANLAVGTYSITARAIDSLGNSRDSAPFEVRVGTTSAIVLPAGLNGTTINSTSLSFAATISAPVNSSVTVNGIVSTVTREGRVIVNGLVLTPGNNTITIVVTPPSGTTLTQTITVTRTTAPPSFDLHVTPTEGIAPVVSLMEVKNPGNTPFAKVLLSCHNPTGNAALAENQSATLAGAMECHYTKAGLYQPWAAITNTAGDFIWASTKFVAVSDPLDGISITRAVYSNAVDQLRAGNSTSALEQLTGDAKAKYGAIFSALGANLATAAAQIGEIGATTVTGDSAEMIVIRNVNGAKKAFSIHLVRGEDGVWRIDSM
jgi:uncharacterized Zn-binding protein involved in type VI secretion